MSEYRNISRRHLLSAAGSLAVAGPLTGCAASNDKLEIGGTTLIRNAFVMTMDPALGDLKSADVLIRDGRIAAVGPNLVAEGASTIDGRDMVAMPGLVDTHTHFWLTQTRGMFGDASHKSYFLTRNRLAAGYQPNDMYHGTKLGAAEAIYGGITTALDFCHNVRNEEYASECVRALRETGLRSRFLLSASTTMPFTQPIDVGMLRTMHAAWASRVGPAPVTLGLGWRGPFPLGPQQAGAQEAAHAAAKLEIEVARSLGLPTSVHVSGAAAVLQIDALLSSRLLGPDVQLIHMSNLGPAHLKAAAQTGASISLTPLTELRVGYGVTQIGDFMDSGARLGIGIDSNALAGSADMFSVMRLFNGIENGRKKSEAAIAPRKLVELATLGGAQSLGMDAEIGSLTPGKRADLILIDMRGINLGMFSGDPSPQLVGSARPENVDTVIVGGRVLKRGGKLTELDAAQLVANARQSIEAIHKRTVS